MIVSSDGIIHSKAAADSQLAATVSLTGDAYRKTTKLKAVVRFVRKFIRTFRAKVAEFYELVVPKFLSTKNGKAQSIEPPMTFNT
jgi:hypothetical protein